MYLLVKFVMMVIAITTNKYHSQWKIYVPKGIEDQYVKYPSGEASGGDVHMRCYECIGNYT